MKIGRASASGCQAQTPNQSSTNPVKILITVLVAALLNATAANCCAQTTSAAMQIGTPGAAPSAQATNKNVPGDATRQPGTRQKREAVKLFVRAAKLYEASHFEEAEALYEKAATLDPTNPNYAAAAALAKSHAVTAYVQKAAASRARGDESSAREDLSRALQLDPRNPMVAQHVDELAGDATRGTIKPLYVDDANRIGPPVELLPNMERHSFHLHGNMRQIITEVFRSYGIEAVIDDSVRAQTARFDVDNLDFSTAARLLSLITLSFYTPIDAHKVIVARDTPNLRQQYERLELETIYLPGMTEKDRSDIQTLAKNIFNLDHAVLDATAGTLTVRALPETLDAFNRTLQDLLDGRSQIMLDVKMYQLAYTKGRTTGAQLPQQMSVFDLASEEQQLLNENQALVQQIISSGLASANDPLAILALLLASGQVSDPVLQQLINGGVGIIGGGASTTAIGPLSTTVNLQINTSDSRELDSMLLRLGDDEKGTIKSGVRYPITTSSFSNALTATSSIPGLNLPGQSSSLSSLISSELSTVASVPMVEYQDIGLTLSATPEVTRDENVVLTLDLKLTSLSGQTVNNVPVLNNRSFSGVVTLKKGDAAVLVSDLDKEESNALSGQPGLAEIPGLNNVSAVNNSASKSTLVIVVTPQVVRGTQHSGHSQMLRVDRKQIVNQ